MQYSYDLFVKELGARLKQMRKDRGWTLRDMVLEHRLHLTQWQRLESGKGISTPSLLRVCEVFDVGLQELVGDLGQTGREPAPPATAAKSAKKPAKKSLAIGAKKPRAAAPPRGGRAGSSPA